MKKRRSRYQQGSVFLDRRRNIWYFKWYDGNSRRTKRLGTTTEIHTKREALEKAEPLKPKKDPIVVVTAKATFENAAQRYMAERMPHRHCTSNGYRNNLEKHILPRWGTLELSAVKPLAVDRWFFTLPLAPKTKTHIKSVMRQVFEYAQLCELIELQRNPMDLVRVMGGTIREHEPRILTHDEWQRLLQFLNKEPMRTVVIVAFCLGLRRSELAGLKWSDFDWIKQEVLIQRGVIGNRVDAVKTRRSKSRLPLDPSLTGVLRSWHRLTEFNSESDWVWASPFVGGAMPYYTNAVQRDYIIPAAKLAGLGRLGWHDFRHTYRAWMGQSQTPLTVQKDLMRHADIKTTMNVYGGAIPEDMREANSRIVRLAIQ